MNHKIFAWYHYAWHSRDRLLTLVWRISPLSGKRNFGLSSAAVRVAEEKEKIPNENRKNQLLKSVNINTSDKADIMTIPRIGPVTAERIILHREDHGLYNSVEELLNVKGIGPKTLEKIRTYIKIED